MRHEISKIKLGRICINIFSMKQRRRKTKIKTKIIINNNYRVDFLKKFSIYKELFDCFEQGNDLKADLYRKKQKKNPKHCLTL